MKSITSKHETLRTAVAECVLRAAPEHVARIPARRIEKGDALEVARVAGIGAAKKTWDLIPFCHPIPIAHSDVRYEVGEGSVRVTATVTSIAPTGVEMEALTAASLAALTIYDMLKPYTSEITIDGLHLVSKTGGKSDFAEKLDPPVRVALLACAREGADPGRSAPAVNAVAAAVESWGAARLEVRETSVFTPDSLAARVRELVAGGVEAVFTVGGTGIGRDDVAVETLAPLLTRSMPGIMETARAHGQRRTPWSMMSRGVAGLIDRTLVVTFPGSRRGAEETADVLVPAVFHVVSVLRREARRAGRETA